MDGDTLRILKQTDAGAFFQLTGRLYERGGRLAYRPTGLAAIAAFMSRTLKLAWLASRNRPMTGP